MIELDRITHTYTDNLPSVTTILKAAGIIEVGHYTELGRQRGGTVHLILEYYDQGILDEATVDPQLIGYLDAYKKALAATGWTFDRIEAPACDKARTYAGTPDRIRTTPPRLLVDVKTGTYETWHAIQAAAYVNMLDDSFGYNRYGLYLQSSGKYQIREFPRAEYARDLSVFQSALNIYYWRQ